MTEDGGLHLLGIDARLAVSHPTVTFEKRVAQRGKYRPVRVKRVDVVIGDTSVQVGVKVVQILGFS